MGNLVEKYLWIPVVGGTLALGMLSAAYTQPETKICYPATPIRVIDGDTVKFSVELFPQIFLRTNIRIYGVDTPEKRKNLAGCPAEIKLAKKATLYAKGIFMNPRNVFQICDPKLGKYAGRAVAKIKYKYTGTTFWKDYAQKLIDKGYAVPYFGKTKRKIWCK